MEIIIADLFEKYTLSQKLQTSFHKSMKVCDFIFPLTALLGVLSMQIFRTFLTQYYINMTK